MKQTRNFPSVQVTRKQEASLHSGHPWVYADEIHTDTSAFENGCLVDVLSLKGQYLGTGLYSEKSLIRIRILSTNANEKFDRAFFARRAAYALQYREDVMAEQDLACCRLIHGEADGLPGLTVDRYNGILVSEVLSYGMEQRKEMIYEELINQLEAKGNRIEGIFERNEGALRLKEGLNTYKGWYELKGRTHPSAITVIEENGLQFEVDVENGQKTGYFLDQKDNRMAVRRLAHSKKVLDCCTHTGSFALNAAKGGAVSVTAMDISASAIEMAQKNAELNGMKDAVHFETGDIFEVLQAKAAAHEKYDLIILDPPAFTKSRKTFHNAWMGYESINMQAMRLLNRGGYLVTNSCSHFMPKDEFIKMLSSAAAKMNVSLRLVAEERASKDHPVLINVPETDYLKFFIVQIL